MGDFVTKFPAESFLMQKWKVCLTFESEGNIPVSYTHLLMSVTPLGYFHTFGLDISLMMVPVAIGAMLMLSLIHI